MIQWINGSMNQWICKSTNQWTDETMEQAINGSMNQWICESPNQWTNVKQWISESMNPWINKSLNHKWTTGCKEGWVEWSGVKGTGGEGRVAERGGVGCMGWSGVERSGVNEWVSERASEGSEWVSEWAEEGGREGVSYFFVELPLHCFEMLPRYLLCGFCNTILFAHPAHCILQPPPANPHSETPHYAEKLHYAQLQRV